MIEFNKYSGVSPNNEDVSLTIASGPVIIQDGKVLVVKHGDDTGWKFPGGKVRDDASPRETAQREAKEELDIVVALEGDPYVVAFTREKNGTQEYVILLHYRARIASGEPRPNRDVREFAWLPIDALPEDCMPNIKSAVSFFKCPGSESN